MKILGIETSCDETAVAVVDGGKKILSNLVLGQIEHHECFGGVVPEIAARAHLDHLDTLIGAAMKDAGTSFTDLAAVAATCGPGLIGGVIVGMMAGKAIAAAHDLPFIAVNHLEAHALTPRLTDNLDFPYLVLLVSGGHTQFLVAEDVGKYKLIGSTVDDALGECFDKAAKLMGLPFPGGPHIERLAAQCANPAAAQERFALPRSMMGRPGCDFSFSGMKTAVRAHVESLPAGPLQKDDIAALAFAFQNALAETVADRCAHAIDEFRANYGTAARALAVCGGVAANRVLRAALQGLCAGRGLSFHAPPLELCADNGAMIAWAGIERLRRGMTDPLDAKARPRWPLDEAQGERGRR